LLKSISQDLSIVAEEAQAENPCFYLLDRPIIDASVASDLCIAATVYEIDDVVDVFLQAVETQLVEDGGEVGDARERIVVHVGSCSIEVRFHFIFILFFFV